jgi:dihydrofolate reductase
LTASCRPPARRKRTPTAAFEHGGWAFGYWDEVVDETMHMSMADPFDLLLGRKTYEIFAAHWPRGHRLSPSGVIMTRYRTGAEIEGGSFVQAELDRRGTQR